MTGADADSVERFAADLRELRLNNGNPILEHLALQCGIGRTVLSNAFRGQALPTKTTVQTLVAVLGGDEQAWIARWSRLRVAIETSSVDECPTPPAESGNLPTRPRWLLAVVGGFCLALGFGGGFAVARLTSTPSPRLASTAVVTGDDPWAQPACQADAVRKGFGTRADHYLVEVFWSQTCNAAWGQVSRFDGFRVGNRMTASTYLAYQPASSLTVTALDVQVVHTPLLVPPSPMQEICVVGSVQVGSDDIDLAPPVCIDTH